MRTTTALILGAGACLALLAGGSCSAAESTGKAGTDEGGAADTAEATPDVEGTEEDPGAALEDTPTPEDVADQGEPVVDTGPELPPNPDEPPAPVVYEGTCPAIVAGAMTFPAAGHDRAVTVTLPKDPQGAGVLFLWHGFGDTGPDFSAAVGAQAMSNTFDVITVSPQAILDAMESEKLAPFKDLAGMFGPLPPTWAILDGPEIDMTLFEGLLYCLDEQFQIDRKRVYTMGFSQGALWSSLLVLTRSEVLAAALLWSGGLGYDGGLVEVVKFDYEKPTRTIPVLAGSGGATDLWPNAQFALVDFQVGTEALIQNLVEDGHAAVHCSHGLGHTVPSDGLVWGLKFLFDHEWQPNPVESPYLGHDGSGFPGYCVFPPGS